MNLHLRALVTIFMDVEETFESMVVTVLEEVPQALDQNFNFVASMVMVYLIDGRSMMNTTFLWKTHKLFVKMLELIKIKPRVRCLTYLSIPKLYLSIITFQLQLMVITYSYSYTEEYFFPYELASQPQFAYSRASHPLTSFDFFK